MFMKPHDFGEASLPGRGESGLVATPESPNSFWIWFYLSVFCNFMCFTLNTVFSTVSVIERHRTFKNSFYTIVLVFSLSVVMSSLCKLVYQFTGMAGLHIKLFDCLSANVDLLFSYFSALLIFFLGLNRFAAFSSPYLNESLMKRKTLLGILFGLLLFSAMITVLIYVLSGMQRVFSKSSITDYASNCILFEVTSFIFYSIPLASSIFYLFSYRSLRSKRDSVVSDVTKSLLDAAERCNLKQGIWILTIYLTSLIIHVTMLFQSVDGTSLIVLNSLGTIISAAPQFGLPLSVLLCSKEAREVTSHICFSRLVLTSVRRSFSSVFSKSRIRSASSDRTLSLSLHSESTAKSPK
ncbi:hypothetical protein V3C99_007599 [Haemonchus contortus]